MGLGLALLAGAHCIRFSVFQPVLYVKRLVLTVDSILIFVIFQVSSSFPEALQAFWGMVWDLQQNFDVSQYSAFSGLYSFGRPFETVGLKISSPYDVWCFVSSNRNRRVFFFPSICLRKSKIGVRLACPCRPFSSTESKACGHAVLSWSEAPVYVPSIRQHGS